MILNFSLTILVYIYIVILKRYEWYTDTHATLNTTTKLYELFK